MWRCGNKTFGLFLLLSVIHKSNPLFRFLLNGQPLDLRHRLQRIAHVRLSCQVSDESSSVRVEKVRIYVDRLIMAISQRKTVRVIPWVEASMSIVNSVVLNHRLVTCLADYSDLSQRKIDGILVDIDTSTGKIDQNNGNWATFLQGNRLGDREASREIPVHIYQETDIGNALVGNSEFHGLYKPTGYSLKSPGKDESSLAENKADKAFSQLLLSLKNSVSRPFEERVPLKSAGKKIEHIAQNSPIDEPKIETGNDKTEQIYFAGQIKGKQNIGASEHFEQKLDAKINRINDELKNRINFASSLADTTSTLDLKNSDTGRSLGRANKNLSDHRSRGETNLTDKIDDESLAISHFVNSLAYNKGIDQALSTNRPVQDISTAATPSEEEIKKIVALMKNCSSSKTPVLDNSYEGKLFSKDNATFNDRIEFPTNKTNFSENKTITIWKPLSISSASSQSIISSNITDQDKSVTSENRTSSSSIPGPQSGQSIKFPAMQVTNVQESTISEIGKNGMGSRPGVKGISFDDTLLQSLNSIFKPILSSNYSNNHTNHALNLTDGPIHSPKSPVAEQAKNPEAAELFPSDFSSYGDILDYTDEPGASILKSNKSSPDSPSNRLLLNSNVSNTGVRNSTTSFSTKSNQFTSNANCTTSQVKQISSESKSNQLEVNSDGNISINNSISSEIQSNQYVANASDFVTKPIVEIKNESGTNLSNVNGNVYRLPNVSSHADASSDSQINIFGIHSDSKPSSSITTSNTSSDQVSTVEGAISKINSSTTYVKQSTGFIANSDIIASGIVNGSNLSNSQLMKNFVINSNNGSSKPNISLTLPDSEIVQVNPDGTISRVVDSSISSSIQPNQLAHNSDDKASKPSTSSTSSDSQANQFVVNSDGTISKPSISSTSSDGQSNRLVINPDGAILRPTTPFTLPKSKSNQFIINSNGTISRPSNFGTLTDNQSNIFSVNLDGTISRLIGSPTGSSKANQFVINSDGEISQPSSFSTPSASQENQLVINSDGTISRPDTSLISSNSRLILNSDGTISKPISSTTSDSEPNKLVANSDGNIAKLNNPIISSDSRLNEYTLQIDKAGNPGLASSGPATPGQPGSVLHGNRIMPIDPIMHSKNQNFPGFVQPSKSQNNKSNRIILILGGQKPSVISAGTLGAGTISNGVVQDALLNGRKQVQGAIISALQKQLLANQNRSIMQNYLTNSNYNNQMNSLQTNSGPINRYPLIQLVKNIQTADRTNSKDQLAQVKALLQVLVASKLAKNNTDNNEYQITSFNNSSANISGGTWREKYSITCEEALTNAKSALKEAEKLITDPDSLKDMKRIAEAINILSQGARGPHGEGIAVTAACKNILEALTRVLNKIIQVKKNSSTTEKLFTNDEGSDNTSGTISSVDKILAAKLEVDKAAENVKDPNVYTAIKDVEKGAEQLTEETMNSGENSGTADNRMRHATSQILEAVADIVQHSLNGNKNYSENEKSANNQPPDESNTSDLDESSARLPEDTIDSKSTVAHKHMSALVAILDALKNQTDKSNDTDADAIVGNKSTTSSKAIAAMITVVEKLSEGFLNRLESGARTKPLGRCLGHGVLFKDRCFWLLWFPTNWESARDYCRHFGGELAQLSSPKSHHFIFKNLLEPDIQENKPNLYWVGLHETKVAGKFHWQNYGLVQWSNFAYGEPSNVRYPDSLTRQRCILLDESGHWNAKDCSQKHQFICERYEGARWWKIWEENIKKDRISKEEKIPLTNLKNVAHTK